MHTIDLCMFHSILVGQTVNIQNILNQNVISTFHLIIVMHCIIGSYIAMLMAYSLTPLAIYTHMISNKL